MKVALFVPCFVPRSRQAQAAVRSVALGVVVRVAALGLAVTGAVCGDPAAVVRWPDDDAVILTPHVWAGNAIEVRASALAVADSAVLLLDGDTVQTRRLDSMTVAADAPTRSAALEVTLAVRGGPLYFPGTARVYGFRDEYEGPRIAGYILPLPGAAPTPTFLANGENALVRVDLRFNAAFAFPAEIHRPSCNRGPGPTPDPRIVLLKRPPGCVLSRWQISPTPQLLEDSIPVGCLRLCAQLNATTYLTGGAHTLEIRYTPTGSGPIYRREDVHGMRFSPRGDRLVVHYAWNSAGSLPVFGASEGDTAFTIRELAESGGAAFSADGDTLFHAGNDTTRSNAPVVVVLDATTGASYATIALRHYWPEDAVIDPVRPYLYVLETSARPTAWVEVVSRTTLTSVAEIPLDVPSNAGFSRLVLDPLARILYVVTPGAVDVPIGVVILPSRIARIDLLP